MRRWTAKDGISTGTTEKGKPITVHGAREINSAYRKSQAQRAAAKKTR